MSGGYDDIPGNGRTLIYRVGELEDDVKLLSRKVDRLMWALVTLTLTIAGSSVVFAITVLSVRSSN